MKKILNLVFIFTLLFVITTSCATSPTQKNEEVKEKVKIKVKVKTFDKNLEEKIIKTITAGDLTGLKIILDPIDDVKTVVGKDVLLLHLAAKSSDAAPGIQGLIEYLVTKKAYLCQVDPEKKEGFGGFQRILMKKEMVGPGFEYIDNLKLGEKFKLYYDSIKEDSVEKLKQFLFFAPATPNMLFNAAKQNSIKIVKFLVEEIKIDINSLDKKGQNALFIVASSYTPQQRKTTPVITWARRVELAKYLIENKIKIDVKATNLKRTPLAQLLEKRITNQNVGSKEPFAKLLIQNGASLTATDKNGYSILYFAVDYPEIVKTAISKGADINDKKVISRLFEEEDVTFFINKGASHIDLFYKLSSIKDEIKKFNYLKLLLKNGLKVKELTRFSAFGNNLEALKLLETLGADIVASNVILSAITNGNLEIVKYIVENKEFNIEKEYYNSKFTIIRRAVEKDKKEIIKYLASKGANLNAIWSRTGQTPYDYANGKELKELLKSLGAKSK